MPTPKHNPIPSLASPDALRGLDRIQEHVERVMDRAKLKAKVKPQPPRLCTRVEKAEIEARTA